jgi:hypothetical protein
MDVLKAFFDEAKRLQLLACAYWREQRARPAQPEEDAAGALEIAPEERDALLRELSAEGYFEAAGTDVRPALRLTEKGRAAVRGMGRRRVARPTR